MATAQNIIDAAFRKIGHSDPTDTDRTEALENLNNMVSSWGPELLAPYVTTESFAVTSGTGSYTIGPAGTWVATRPIKIESAFLRNSDNYDFPLSIINQKDYNEIYYKSNSFRPTELYYYPSYALGYIYFDCLPDATYTCYISNWKNLTEFAALSTTVSLPNEYKNALVYNLAVTLAEDKGVTVQPTVLKTAKDLKDNLSTLNAMNSPVPESKLDIGARTYWNIVTGEYQ